MERIGERKDGSMFEGKGIHDWWMKIAALTAGATQPPLNQTGRSRDGEEGEFVGVEGGKFLPSEFVFSGGQQLTLGPALVGQKVKGKNGRLQVDSREDEERS